MYLSTCWTARESRPIRVGQSESASPRVWKGPGNGSSTAARNSRTRRTDHGLLHESCSALDRVLSSPVSSHSGKRRMVGHRIYRVDEHREGASAFPRSLSAARAG